MEIIQEMLRGGFESSTRNTPAFKGFARKFKNALAKELATIDAKITYYNVGHFYVSGFFRTASGQCIYFALSDARFFAKQRMLYRSARDEKDFTGGVNQYVTLESGMAKQMRFYNGTTAQPITMTTEHSYTLTVQQYNYLLPVFGIAAQGRTRLLARCGGYYFIGTYEDYLDALNRCIYI